MKVIVLIGFLMIFFLMGLFASEKIRQPLLAGSWYEGSKDGLNKQVDSLVNKARENIKPSFEKPLIALVVPHAGYIYSGYGAAAGYYLIQKHNYDRIIVLAFSHSFYHTSIAVSNFDKYKTPIGEINVDLVLANELLKQKDIFETIPAIDEREHSMEIQLPFIQKCAPNAKALGLYVGNLTKEKFIKAAEVLKKYIQPKTLFVVSSDFTHYGENYGYLPFPPNEDVKKNLSNLDGGAINEIINYNADGFQNYLKQTGTTICGRNPIILLLLILKASNKNIKGSLISYYTSGDVIGDYTNSVSYTTIGFYENSIEKKPKLEINKGGLTNEEKKILLKLARDSIKYYFEHNELMMVDAKEIIITQALKEIRGAFVTLKINNSLRGCIGHIQGVQELYKDVIENAINAAFNDPRFMPLSSAELPKVEIEISALTPPVKINSLDEIIIGKHGLIIKKGYQSGVFLPQVPVEQGWNKTQYLENLCYKAGLSKDDYKQADLYMFTAEVFSEKEMEHLK